MKVWSDLDYVDYYAEKLREDNSFFEQQRMLIESQLAASKSLFKNIFGKKNYKKAARKYLKSVKLI